MGSKHLGGDVNLAWPTAQIAVMGAAGAVSILYRRELATAPDPNLMVDGTSHMFITGPDVIKTVTGEDVTFEELGGAHAHASRSGVAHYQAADEEDCIEFAKLLLSYLPSNNLDELPAVPAAPTTRSARRTRNSTSSSPTPPTSPTTSTGSSRPSWTRYLLRGPRGVRAEYRRRLRPGRRRPGRGGGQPAAAPGRLPGHRCLGESRPVRQDLRRLLIPVLTFVDVPGFLPGVTQEWAGIIRRGAKLLYAYAEATVPKVTVITRKAYGGAYDVMGSKHLGGDVNLAWPTAQIAVMGAAGAVSILYRRELASRRRPRGAPHAENPGVRRHPRQPLHRRRARLHRRRHPPRPNPHPRHPRPDIPAHQTRNPPTQKTRQHPAVSAG